MKKLLLAASAALATLVANSAMAADLAVPPKPVYVPPPAVLAFFTWTGCYIGANGGGLWAHRDFSDTAFGAGFGSHTASGGLGGIQGGCNYQRGSWVFGVEGDYDWASATGSNLSAAFPLVTDQSKVKALASLTARTGYAWNRFFGYVKGGGAWLKSDFSLQLASTAVTTISETRDGWTIGVGGEYAFLDWLTGFVEYDYYKFRNSTNTFVCATCGFAVAGVPVGAAPFSVDTNVNVIKAGVNLKFGPTAFFR
jgi:outer membrane immunogenic protein